MNKIFIVKMIKLREALNTVRQAPIFYHQLDLVPNAWNLKQKKRKKNLQNQLKIKKRPHSQRRVKKLVLRDN